MAKWLILIGALLVVVGLLWQLFPGLFNWMGRMPGDVAYRSDSGRVRVYFPIVTMVIVSIVGTILLNLFMRR